MKGGTGFSKVDDRPSWNKTVKRERHLATSSFDQRLSIYTTLPSKWYTTVPKYLNN